MDDMSIFLLCELGKNVLDTVTVKDLFLSM